MLSRAIVAHAIGARREEIKHVAQQSDFVLAGLPLAGTVSSGKERKTTRPGLSTPDAGVAHAAGLAGNGFEEDGRGVGARSEGIGEVRPINRSSSRVEAGIMAIVERGVHAAGDGIAGRAQDGRHAEIFVAIEAGRWRVGVLHEARHLEDILAEGTSPNWLRMPIEAMKKEPPPFR